MTDRDYIFAFDLNGKDVNVRIKQVKAGTLVGERGKKDKKPVAYFHGKEKALALNATNCKTIATMYGNDVDDWVDKWITLYPTTTEMGGQTVECIRVRPRAPQVRANGNGQQQQREPEPKSEPEPAAFSDEQPYDGPPEPGADG